MLNKVLLIDDRPGVSELFSENLKVYVNSKTVIVKNLKEALLYLKSDVPIDLLICRNEIKGEETGRTLALYLSSHFKEIPTILLGCDKKYQTNIRCLEEPFELKELIRQSASFLSMTAKEMASRSVEDF